MFLRLLMPFLIILPSQSIYTVAALQQSGLKSGEVISGFSFLVGWSGTFTLSQTEAPVTTNNSATFPSTFILMIAVIAYTGTFSGRNGSTSDMFSVNHALCAQPPPCFEPHEYPQCSIRSSMCASLSRGPRRPHSRPRAVSKRRRSCTGRSSSSRPGGFVFVCVCR